MTAGAEGDAMTTTLNLTQQFIQKSREATAFDWDLEEYPDPTGVEDLFKWLRQKLTGFDVIPPQDLFFPGARFLNIHFNDNSHLSIRHNPLLDEVKLTEGTSQYPADRPATLMVHQDSRAGYTYFKQTAALQRENWDL